MLKKRGQLNQFGSIVGRHGSEAGSVRVAAAVETLERRQLLSAASAAPEHRADRGADGHDEHHGPELPVYLPARHELINPGGYLSAPRAGAPLDVARAFLTDRAADLGVTPADVAAAEVTDLYTTPDTGVTHVYLRQTLNDLPIVNAVMNVNVAADGRVLNVGGGFVSAPKAAAPGADRARAVRPATAAVSAAAAELGLPPLAEAPRNMDEPRGLARATRVRAPQASRDPIPAKLQYVATAAGGVELAWGLVMRTPDGDHWYDVSVGAYGGGLLHGSDWSSHATYNVYELPTDAPNDDPTGTAARLVRTDTHDTTASPHGWHDTNGAAGAEFTDTRGNNVFAQEDADDNDTGGYRPAGGAGLGFNFPLTAGAAPLVNRDAAIANLFYLNNRLHDIHYNLGFNELSGNFQVNNYGRGGAGGDAVVADAQDGSGLNNANMATPPDGQSPRMQMFLFDRNRNDSGNDPGDLDGDFDNGIVIHEYGHGVSTRLTGGPANSGSLDALQSGGMGEGWSDWWALMFTQRPGDTQSSAHGLGTYVIGQSNTGGGIRRYPYSFDKAVNPLTYGNFNVSSEVHDSGEIWASALWDMNWLLTGRHGFDADIARGYSAADPTRNGGNVLALKLVADALKLQPANPSFLDGRNAILQADLVLTGGANQDLIWQAFARRGMGAGAYDGGHANAQTVVESFDLPSPDPVVYRSTPAGQSFVPVSSATFLFNEPINPASFAPAADVVAFTGPGGADLRPQVTGSAWVDSKTLRVDFTTRSAEGDYALTIGPNVLAADNGRAMDQDRDGTPGEAGQDAYTARFRVGPVLVADGFGYTASSVPLENIDLVAGAPGVVTLIDAVDDSPGSQFATIPLGGNTFNFYGQTYTGTGRLFVGATGLVTFGTGNESWENGNLAASPSAPTIAALWEDLVTYDQTADDRVLYRFDDLGGAPGPDRLVVEWSELYHYDLAAPSTVTFQAILQLNTGTQPGEIVFNYRDLDFGTPAYDNGAGATVGIKDGGNQGAAGARRLLVTQDSAAHPFVATGRAMRIAKAAAPPPAAVAGRHVFYNNSAFDGNGAAADARDDAAVDAGKSALLPGQTAAAAANVTAYSRGINGVMVDVTGLPPGAVTGGLLGPEDVAVRATSPAAPDAWSAGPAPTSVTVRAGAGVGGSDRVTLVWPDGAIVNRWVEVTLLANADTRLPAPDVFAFGNLIGDADGSRTVNLADFGAQRQDFNATGRTVANGRSDFNRDGAVNLADFGTLRSNFGKSLPAAPALAPASSATSLLSATDEDDDDKNE